MEDDDELHNSLREAILDEFRSMSSKLNDDMESFSSHDMKNSVSAGVSLSGIFTDDGNVVGPAADLSVNELALRPIAQPMKPSWWSEAATQSASRYAYCREFNRWDEVEVEIKIPANPFAVGPTRAAYCMKIADRSLDRATDVIWADVSDFVVKLYVDMAPLAKEQRSTYA
jgi:hypothetical protein